MTGAAAAASASNAHDVPARRYDRQKVFNLFAEAFCSQPCVIFEKGKHLFRADEDAGHCYILVEGQIKITQMSETGRAQILWFCLPGDVFGIVEAITASRRAVAAEVMVRSRVQCVSRARLLRAIEERPALALATIEVMSGRLRGLGELSLCVAAHEVKTRILRLFMELARSCGVHCAKRGDIRLDIALTHQNIAEMASCTRQSVTTALRELKDERLVSMHNGRYHFRAPPRAPVVRT